MRGMFGTGRTSRVEAFDRSDTYRLRFKVAGSKAKSLTIIGEGKEKWTRTRTQNRESEVPALAGPSQQRAHVLQRNEMIRSV